MALPAAGNDNGGHFTTHHVVDTHVWGKDLSVVWTNETVSMESSIQSMEQLLAEDKYQVVGFDLEFTGGRVGQYEKNLVNSCDHYNVWGNVNTKQNSLVDFASSIIDPYYMKMKYESKKD
ncbi:putative methyltransferase PMT27 [Hordeum vulgare]|nr:putative methyltransferase PMT27 [Hordeum vulgare]